MFNGLSWKTKRENLETIKAETAFWTLVGLETSTKEDELKEYVKETPSMERPHDRHGEWL